MMPLVHRLVSAVNLAEADIWAPGDLEFRARAVIWRDRKFAPRHLVSLIGGLEVSSIGIFPTKGTADTKVGLSFRQTALGQFQPWRFLAFQLGVEFRIDQPGYIAGVRDPNTGGHITYGTFGLVGLPHDKVLLHFTAAVPMIQRLDGSHVEGLALTAGLVYEI